VNKNETIALIGLAAVAYFLFSQSASASSGTPGGSGTVNIPPPGGFVGPCQPPYVTGPSGCILPTGGGSTSTGSGDGTITDLINLI
jgi:hypothetical protein